MKVGMRFAVACGLLVTIAAGCTCMQKPWGYGTLGGAVAGAVGGGIATGAASNNTGAFDIGNDNEDKALAVATGVIGGSILGALIGHCLWDRAPMVAAAPPPPPPAPAPAAPPPPPPPVTERRGG